MARVALISCNTTEEPYPVYPLGMSMVAGAVRNSGHDVLEYDIFAQGKDLTLEQFLRESQPEYIGLSLRNVDSANFNKPEIYVDAYKKIVQSIRKVSIAPVILGGSAYTIFPEEMLEEIEADYGIAGEGEASFCRLINQLEKDVSSAPKITFNNPELSGNDFSALSRNDSLAEYYLKNGGMLSVQTKRGCPHRCAYCSYPVLEGRRYRFREAGDVVDEIEMLIKKYRADYYAITDSVFNDAAGHYLEVAEELIHRNITVPWMCYLRPDYFQQEEVDILKKAGLRSIEWGTDGAVDETLQAMQKSFTWDQVVHSNDIFGKAGLSNAHFMIFGGPGETRETLREGLENLKGLENCAVFAGIGVRIFPGTAVYKIAIDEGKITADQNILPPTYYFSDSINREQMHQTILDSFEGQLDRIYPDGQYVEAAKAFHSLGNRGPAWDMLLNKGIRR